MKNIIEKILKKAFAKIAIYAIVAAIVVIIVVVGLVMLIVWLIGGRGGQSMLPQIEAMISAPYAAPLNAGELMAPELGAGFEELGQEFINIGETIDQIRP